MPSAQTLAALQKFIANPLPRRCAQERFAGIVGDGPSHYSKSPALWNAAFNELRLSAVYLPFDVTDAQLGGFFALLRGCDDFMGLNVTVPHKQRVIELIDELDPGAARIQAVNTVVRSAAGKLLGYNTDGEGFIESLLALQSDRPEPFLPALADMDALLLGAGGSARAVAFHLSDHLGAGRLIIANRTLKYAAQLAAELAKLGRNAVAIDDADISRWAPNVGLIVNCTTKGQGGMRSLPDGSTITLEPYSALAPAHPPAGRQSMAADSALARDWLAAAKPDIDANHEASLRLARSIPPSVRFFDLVYHPEETVFLRHGRITGHPTMNGKNMIVNQAAIAFCRRICQRQLAELGQGGKEILGKVAETMRLAW